MRFWHRQLAAPSEKSLRARYRNHDMAVTIVVSVATTGIVGWFQELKLRPCAICAPSCNHKTPHNQGTPLPTRLGPPNC